MERSCVLKYMLKNLLTILGATTSYKPLKPQSVYLISSIFKSKTKKWITVYVFFSYISNCQKILIFISHCNRKLELSVWSVSLIHPPDSGFDQHPAVACAKQIPVLLQDTTPSRFQTHSSWDYLKTSIFLWTKDFGILSRKYFK